MSNSDSAPGEPGIPSRWTSSAKEGVGTALNSASRVWFTISHGIVNEVYYPRVDQACTRDMELLVADGRDFFSEEKRHTDTTVEYLARGVPAYRVTNRCLDKRYTIVKEVLTDPTRDTLLQKLNFSTEVPTGATTDLHLYALLAPHLGNRGMGNTARVGDYKGVPVLLAERDGIALALACSAGWRQMSAGFVGFSDGWQDISRHKRMTWQYSQAANGNVALTGEIPLPGPSAELLLAMGFGLNWAEAAHRAVSSLEDDYDQLKQRYIADWQQWQQKLLDLGEVENTPPSGQVGGRKVYRISTVMMRAHEEKRIPGGIIASLSIPWGASKGDDDLGGYHLAWPRDLCETAGGLLAAGAREDARRVLHYLHVTQEADGHWAQNMWLDGQPYWSGVQMDETALPILLVDLARRESAIDAREVVRLWPMVRRAAAFIVCNGPVTQQDRWEEDAGYSPFTLATEIAALLAAAELAEHVSQSGTDSLDLHAAAVIADYLGETADAWNSNLDHWIYARDTELSRRLGTEGYYVRIAPPDAADGRSPLDGFVPIKNRPPSDCGDTAMNIVSPDALALVRFGLRAADDPRIVNTVKAIDAVVKVDLPQGSCWRRYNHDGYGEHEDGMPFDGTGVGRAWPLLTGERAHFELAAGRRGQARLLLHTFQALANHGGLFPEQTWDADDVPGRELFRGRPSGSAMPLVWAHAEYVKLLRSLRDGKVFDMPPQAVRRYQHEQVISTRHIWRFNHKCRSLPAGKELRIETLRPARIRWTTDGWNSVRDTDTADSLLGVYFADLRVSGCAPGTRIDLTFFWPHAERWEDKEFSVTVTA